MINITTSWDDGSKTDFQIAALLKKYDLPGIFFIPTNKRELSEGNIRELVDRGFIIGGHTVNHYQDLKKLSNAQLAYEIMANKLFLEAVIDKPVVHFCYPRGRYDERVTNVVKNTGFVMARTTLVGNTKLSDNIYRVNPTVHVNKYRPEYKGQKWATYAREKFLEAQKEEQPFYHIWGHSWEVEKFNLWGELELLFKWLKETNK